jgi:hypothetical protein
MKIDGHEFRLLRDYDRGQYKYLSFKGKAEYLENRVKLILIDPCRTAMKAAAVQDAGLGFILTTGICAMVSAAGTFLMGGRAPKGKDKKSFVDFVHAYMDPDLQDVISSYGMTWADWLYDDVRCGLAHGFVIHVGGIEINAKYLEIKPCGPEICCQQLLEDFAQGWGRYLVDVRRDGKGIGLGTLFERRFDEIFHD